jgi:hypothetical protein
MQMSSKTALILTSFSLQQPKLRPLAALKQRGNTSEDEELL